jgi:hypothetical protein
MSSSSRVVVASKDSTHAFVKSNLFHAGMTAVAVATIGQS